MKTMAWKAASRALLTMSMKVHHHLIPSVLYATGEMKGHFMHLLHVSMQAVADSSPGSPGGGLGREAQFLRSL